MTKFGLSRIKPDKTECPIVTPYTVSLVKRVLQLSTAECYVYIHCDEVLVDSNYEAQKITQHWRKWTSITAGTVYPVSTWKQVQVP